MSVVGKVAVVGLVAVARVVGSVGLIGVCVFEQHTCGEYVLKIESLRCRLNN